jgi:hypothetical protein
MQNIGVLSLFSSAHLASGGLTENMDAAQHLNMLYSSNQRWQQTLG